MVKGRELVTKTTVVYERDAKGRFVKGHRGGPGRPRKDTRTFVLRLPVETIDTMQQANIGVDALPSLFTTLVMELAEFLQDGRPDPVRGVTATPLDSSYQPTNRNVANVAQ